MPPDIIFYDLPSKGGNHCWSPNTWKTRIYLNFKGLVYRTEWVEYPDIKPRFQGLVQPDETGKYSLPTVLLYDGTYIMDSQKIAIELEKQCPEPSVGLDSPYVSRLQAVLPNVIESMRPILIPNVPKLFLNEASRPYFLETRAKAFGMPLNEVEIKMAGPQCYTKARPSVGDITAMLWENPAGPFFSGAEVCYADLMWVSYLRFVEKIDPEILKEMLGEGAGEHMKLLEACRPWLERDSY